MPPNVRRRVGATFDVSDDIVRELRGALDAPHASPARAPQAKPKLDLSDMWAPEPQYSRAPLFSPRPKRSSVFSLLPWLIGAGMVVTALLYVSHVGLHLKARVVQEGNAAIGHLVAAKGDLEQLDFTAAKNDFAHATDSFIAAQDQLGIVGSGLGKVLAKLPGGQRLRSAQDLLQAGRLISEAGTSMSQAVAALSSSGSILDPKSGNSSSLGDVLGPIQKALDDADRSMAQAATLLASVDASSLPPDSQEQFTSFMEHLPQVRSLITQAHDGVGFLSRLVGTDRPRRYLLLFQNSSELRPTGGFPGSYGLVTFEHGRLRDVSADDIYNPDGQIKQLVVPPLELQHITPAWGMRDANWFIDFPTSARKVMEFYRKGGGTAVDGVIALRPEVMAEILRITGPVSLPQYDLVLTADNFLPTIQLEVESQKTDQPKQVIMDLAPLVLAKLSALPPQSWAKVLDLFKDGLVRRDIMMYLDDADMQKYATTQGWDGQVRQTTGDYLLTDISNIKGAKADAVTDTTLKLESWLEGGTLVHRLTIARAHNGGHSEYGFYNKTNYSYVRVLVPKGSTLRGIDGNDRPTNRPMVNYATLHAVRDPDLERLEATYQYDAVRAATTYEESGKTGFGFWMRVEPGKTQQIQLEYAVPSGAVSSRYALLVQRQPGLDIKDFEFTFQKGATLHPVDPTLPMTEWPDSWRLHDSLHEDFELGLTLK